MLFASYVDDVQMTLILSASSLEASPFLFPFQLGVFTQLVVFQIVGLSKVYS